MVVFTLGMMGGKFFRPVAGSLKSRVGLATGRTEGVRADNLP